MEHRPRKSLGQHFLHETEIVSRILNAFDPAPDDVVVEIGPGLGALTLPLAERIAVLHTVEIDADLVARLRESVPEQVVIHHADAMAFDYGSVAGSGPLRIIGNLPYNLSTPLLFRLLDQSACIRDMLLMLQREVVDRMRAAPGSRSYGRLSVMVQQRCRVQKVLSVSPGAFRPRPKVDSAVVRLEPLSRPAHPVSDGSRFSQMVRLAFAQRRKTLRNALKAVCDERCFAQAGIDPGLRAEQLSVADFVRLSETRL